MGIVVEGFRRPQGTQTPMLPITAPVSISHQTLFPQELPSVELSAQSASLLSIPDRVTWASGFPQGWGLFSHL